MADACCSCENIKTIVKEIVKELFDERLAKITTEVKTRKKRNPSKYNIFMGTCVKEGGNFKTCAVKWNAKKKEAK